MRLLVVEDNEKLASLMKKLLSESGFAVDCMVTADEAVSAFQLAEYDLVVLDLSLFDKDGTEVLKSLRKAGHSTPVLVATARADVTQRVQLLNMGADDYIVKPFSLDELLARVRALLRRPKQIAGSVLALGNLMLDTAAMTLKVDGNVVELPRRSSASRPPLPSKVCTEKAAEAPCNAACTAAGSSRSPEVSSTPCCARRCAFGDFGSRVSTRMRVLFAGRSAATVAPPCWPVPPVTRTRGFISLVMRMDFLGLSKSLAARPARSSKWNARSRLSI